MMSKLLLLYTTLQDSLTQCFSFYSLVKMVKIKLFQKQIQMSIFL